MAQASRRRDVTAPAWSESVHVDIGALAQRVTGLENSVQDIRVGIQDLSKKLDTKPTNWIGVISALVAVLAVVGGAIAFLIAPINDSLSRHERALEHVSTTALSRPEYTEHHQELERWITNLRDRMRADEDVAVTRRDVDAIMKRIDEEVATRIRNDSEVLAHLGKDVDRLSATSVTRAEMDADSRRTDERINTLGSGLHDLQHDFYTSGHSPAAISPAK